MDVFFSILYYALIIAFTIAYSTSFVLNLIREIKVTKDMKTNANKVKAKVIEIIEEKKRVYVKVEYVSPVNYVKFVDFFEFTKKEFNNQYYVDQEIEIYYPNIDNLKRVTYFPTFLSEDKIKLKISPLFTDALLAFVGGFIIGWLTNQAIKTNFHIFDLNNFALSCSTSSPLLHILAIFMFITTIPYLLERFTMASREENQNYLKLYGAKCMAEVKTFKFGRSKDAKGNKESMLEIEFYDNKGQLVKANLNSFMYTETQEQYINILYDLKNPKNVVYMRK